MAGLASSNLGRKQVPCASMGSTFGCRILRRRDIQQIYALD